MGLLIPQKSASAIKQVYIFIPIFLKRVGCWSISQGVMLGYIQKLLFFHPFLWSVPMVIYRHRACKIETVENWVTSLSRFMFRDASLAGVISHMGLFILHKSANTTKQISRLVYLFIYNCKEEPAVGTLPNGHSTMHSSHFTVCNGHSTCRHFSSLNTLQHASCRGFGKTGGVSHPWTLYSSTEVQGARWHIWAVGYV